jgi:hypothetical protein
MISRIDMKREMMRRLESIESNLKVIENANKTVRNSFHITQWLIIHQGNDVY